MRQYATTADFIERYGESEALSLTRLEDPNATSIDTNLLTKRLIDASERVHSYLGIEIGSPYPVVVVDVVCTIARALLDRNRRREDVQYDYEVALQWCRDAAKGLVKIPGTDAVQVLPVRGAVALIQETEGGDWYGNYRCPVQH